MEEKEINLDNNGVKDTSITESVEDVSIDSNETDHFQELEDLAKNKNISTRGLIDPDDLTEDPDPVELNEDELADMEFQWPYPEIYQFYEGMDPDKFSLFNGENLNKAPNQLFENMKYFLMKVQAGDGSVTKANRIEIVTELPEETESTTMYLIYEGTEIKKMWFKDKEYDFTVFDTELLDGVDLDDIISSKTYFCQTVTNCPENLTNFFLRVFSTEDGSNVYQVAYGATNRNAEFHIYLRYLKIDDLLNTNTPWTEVGKLPDNVVFNDEPVSFLDSVTFEGTTTFNGESEFTQLPTSSVAPTENNQLTNKEYVDGAIQNELSLLSPSIIGQPGKCGFGVGIYNKGDISSYGLTPLEGYTEPSSVNYGNYIHNDSGSIMVFIPKFYYRIGNSNAVNYSKYGSNTIEIVGADTYSTASEAEVDGFVLHRAFIDGGEEKSGFFIDKYLCSLDSGAEGVVSIKNENPVSIGNVEGFQNSSKISGYSGSLYESVTLARARGAGFNVPTVFMYSALSMIALCHAQYSRYDIYNEWYDSGTDNFPKGCNTNLTDINDSSIIYTSAEDQDSMKPLTGSCNNLSKTSHNGQLCGVMDLSGCMDEIAIGITKPGTSETDATVVPESKQDLYILKESRKLSDMTGGWNKSISSYDLWGEEDHLLLHYDKITNCPINLDGNDKGSTPSFRWGNGSNQVIPNDSSGTTRALAGVIPMNTDSVSELGTDLYGKDGIWASNVNNCVMTVGGNWTDGTASGIFTRKMYRSRIEFNQFTDGMRCAIYGK